MMFSSPHEGQTITVTTKYRDEYLYSDKKWRHTTYENVSVLPSQRGDHPNTFRIPAVGEPHITERIISLANVNDLRVNGHKKHQNNIESNVRVVKVKGSKGNEYTVVIEGNDPKSCDCLGYQYRENCRHLHEALKTVDPVPQIMDNNTKSENIPTVGNF